jgi:predicted RNA binding protein YcfA (HicA-like mRNA interferase family)
LGKLRVLSGREVCEILSRHGFAEVRRKGSHVIMQQRLPNTTLTVVVPDHKPVRRGTLKSIISQSKLPSQLFEV